MSDSVRQRAQRIPLRVKWQEDDEQKKDTIRACFIRDHNDYVVLNGSAGSGILGR